jgi:hypothetical protein
MSNAVLTLLIERATKQANGGSISVENLKAIVDDMRSGLVPIYTQTERICTNDLKAAIANKRHDLVGRIVVQTFEDILDKPNCPSRKHIRAFINALKMIVGEANYATFQTQAETALSSLEGSVDPWKDFYRHPAVLEIREKIQIIFAKTFQRFEARKNWFIIVMNNNPTSISISSTVFAVQQESDTHEKYDFSEAHFGKILKAIFSNVSLNKITPEYEQAFKARWGKLPQEVFKPILVELSRC